MSRHPPKATWPTEADMFAAFIGAVEPLGLHPYPESCGHDLVLRVGPEWEARDALEDGDLVAVEGKLRANLHLLAQSVPRNRQRWTARGTDFYAVLVPGADSDFRAVADALGVVVIALAPGDLSRFRTRWLPPQFGEEHRCYGDVVELPPQVRQPAGLAGPRTVTPWKLAAVRICLRGTGAELRTADFRGGHVRPRTFVDRGWMRPVRREGREQVYELVEHPTRPDVVYPEIVAAVGVLT